MSVVGASRHHVASCQAGRVELRGRAPDHTSINLYSATQIQTKSYHNIPLTIEANASLSYSILSHDLPPDRNYHPSIFHPVLPNIEPRGPLGYLRTYIAGYQSHPTYVDVSPQSLGSQTTEGRLAKRLEIYAKRNKCAAAPY